MAETPVPTDPGSGMPPDPQPGMQGNPQPGIQGNPQPGMQGDPQFGMQGNPCIPRFIMVMNRERPISRCSLCVGWGIGSALIITILVFIAVLIWAASTSEPGDNVTLRNRTLCNDGLKCSRSCGNDPNDNPNNDPPRSQKETDDWGILFCKSGKCLVVGIKQFICGPNPNSNTSTPNSTAGAG